jgi:transposase
LPLEIVLRGILIVLSQGCKWRAIDGPDAAWNSVYQYYRRWTRQGIFTQLFVQIELPLQGSQRFVDSTHVKLHRCASNPCGGQASQAMGRTKGGMNTKIHAVVDQAGHPIRLLLSAGNDADISHAQIITAEIPAKMVVADKGYDSDEFRQWLTEHGITPCIPPRSNRKKACSYSKRTYRKRHVIENFFERIKNFRRVATRYDKLAETFLGFVCLAATLVSLLF